MPPAPASAPEVHAASGPAAAGPPEVAAAPPSEPPADAPEVTALDAQAAQLAEELPLLDPELPPVVAAALAPPPAAAGSQEAQLRSGADELLVQYMLDGVFEGQVYPWGYPIDQVVQQQRSLVAALSPEQRAEQLEAALRSWTPRRAVPHFTDPAANGAVWEGGGIDRWLLQDSTQTPR